MFKANILNLVLFIVVIALASVIYFSEQESTLLPYLTDDKTAGITSITIKHNNNTTVINKNETGEWEITRPVTVAANDFRIKSVLKLLNAPVHSQYTLDEINLDDAGLANPSTSIQLNDRLIEFGITNPATSLRYIKLNNNVYTIEDVYYPLLSSHFGTLVSLKLLPAGSKISKLILANQTISKDERGFWQSNLEISADNINRVLEHWNSAQAFGVHEYLQRKEQLGEVFIYLEDRQQPLTYIITDTDPWLVLARPEIGLEYHLDSEAYKQFISPQ